MFNECLVPSFSAKAIWKLSLLEGWLMRTDPEKNIFIAVKKVEQLVFIHNTLNFHPSDEKKVLLARGYTVKSVFS